MTTSREWRQGKLIVILLIVAIVLLFSSHGTVDVKVYSGNADNDVSSSPTRTSESPLVKRDSQSIREEISAPGTSTSNGGSFPFHANRHSTNNYPRSPFLYSEGYHPNGGKLPLDPADSLMDPNMWRFVDNHTCLTEDADAEPELWQYRAPYAILLGAMKAGTHAVIESLWEHPSVVRTGHWELHFFDSPRASRSDKGIHRSISLRNYAKAVRAAIGPNISVESSFVDNQQIMVDNSPKYILNSDRIPELILCVSPWVKLMAILRDPVARAESHYRFLDESRRANDMPMVDWQVWIDDDLRLLAGVLNASTPKEEYHAWKGYQRRPHSQQIIGRGLYVITLEHYLRAMDHVQKPRSDLWVIQSERFLKYRQEEFDKLLHFLNLPSHTLSNVSTEIHKTSDGANPMPDSIRHQLQNLYRPYNARLYQLLGWDHVWD